MEALAKLFVFSLRKYMQAAKETATCIKRSLFKIYIVLRERGREKAISV
jgi:hypothetical protein